MKKFAIIILCLAYLVSPIDLLPEAFLGPLGLPDDLLAIFVAIRTYFKS